MSSWDLVDFKLDKPLFTPTGTKRKRDDLASAMPRTKKRKTVDAKVLCEQGQQVIQAFDPGAIVLYTDGACNPTNPGPCGAGVACWNPDSKTWIERAVALGDGTNNIAELAAIGLGFTLLRELETARGSPFAHVELVTDSAYVQGVLCNASWKPKKNRQLIAALASQLTALNARANTRVGLHVVRGHVGIEGNERADCQANKGASGNHDHKNVCRIEPLEVCKV